VLKSISKLSNEAISESKGYVCPSDRCGRFFSEPFQITDLSNKPQEETYYACPFCFSRIDVNEIPRDTERPDVKPQILSVLSALSSKNQCDEKINNKNEINVPECPHQFGYLKKRSKGEAIPDECFTCVNILQCMS
jgi:DNA-directed RNA polymerase subunit RPC12/RpoP